MTFVVLDTPPSLGFLTLGAIYAATGLLVTVHPAMLDVMSMSQFLLMMSDMIRVIHDAGAVLKQDFLHYLITRHDPNDQPQAQVVALLRHLFAEDVLMPTAVESTAIESAGLAKRTLYELEPGNIGRDTFRRARDSMDAVNERILELIEECWGRRCSKTSSSKSIIANFALSTSEVDPGPCPATTIAAGCPSWRWRHWSHTRNPQRHSRRA